MRSLRKTIKNQREYFRREMRLQKKRRDSSGGRELAQKGKKRGGETEGNIATRGENLNN